MAKKAISHRSFTKGIWFAISFFILMVILRVLFIFIPPLVMHVSPQVIGRGQDIIAWGFMGSKSVRRASRLMLGGVPIADENIRHWGLFTIRARFTEQARERLKKNAHGVLYVQYKNYQSKRFLIALSHGNATGTTHVIPSIPRLTMTNEKLIYSKDNLVFTLDASRANTNPLFIEEYSFVVETSNATHTVYPHEWNSLSETSIAFSLPRSLFPTLPQASMNAELRVMYKNMHVSTYHISLAAAPMLSPAPYEFVAEFVYGTTFGEDTTIIMPLSRPWQRVHEYDKRSGVKRNVDNKQLSMALMHGFMKNFDIKKISFLITRYPFHSFNWNTRSALEERTTFFRNAQDVKQGKASLFIPRYLQHNEAYFDAQLNERIRSAAIDARKDSALSLSALIEKFAREAEALGTDAITLRKAAIFDVADAALADFARGLEKPAAATESAKKLAMLAGYLRHYGIPAHVVIGLVNKTTEGVKRLNGKLALWLEVFHSQYGIVPLLVRKNFSTISVSLIDHRFLAYAVLEHMAYLDYLNQKPQLPIAIKSFTLRN